MITSVTHHPLSANDTVPNRHNTVVDTHSWPGRKDKGKYMAEPGPQIAQITFQEFNCEKHLYDIPTFIAPRQSEKWQAHAGFQAMRYQKLGAFNLGRLWSRLWRHGFQIFCHNLPQIACHSLWQAIWGLLIPTYFSRSNFVIKISPFREDQVWWRKHSIFVRAATNNNCSTILRKHHQDQDGRYFPTTVSL